MEEAFVARRPAIRLLVVPQRRAALEKIVLHATNLRIPIVEVEGGSLTALAGFDGHQGVALVVEPRRYAGIDDVLARAAERGESPFVLVLDSLEDPHNVGSLLRSAEAAGVHGVLYPTHRQAPLGPSAVKASAGAVEHLLLCPVDDLPAALSDLHVRGLRIAGADGGAPLTARQSDLRGPLAIVVGSEGQGLGPAVRRRCDLFMRIPMRGAVGSLNAAVAGSILLFEAVAQRESADIDQALPAPAADAAPAATAPADAAPADTAPAVVVEGDIPAGVADASGTEEQVVVTTPTKPAEPATRARPTTSTSPAVPARAAKAAQAATSTSPTRPTKRASSARPAESPVVVLGAVPTGTSGTADKPGKPEKSGKADKPRKPGKPGKAEKSSKSKKSHDAEKPDKTSGHAKRERADVAPKGGQSDAGALVEDKAIVPVGSGDDDLLPEDGAAPVARSPKPRPSRARQGT